MGQGSGFGRIAAGVMSVGLALSATSALAQAVVHVSPEGDDSNSGSQTRPVQSLTRAQALVRSQNGRSDVTVELAGGTYRLDRPLTESSLTRRS